MGAELWSIADQYRHERPLSRTSNLRHSTARNSLNTPAQRTTTPPQLPLHRAQPTSDSNDPPLLPSPPPPVPPPHPTLSPTIPSPPTQPASPTPVPSTSVSQPSKRSPSVNSDANADKAIGQSLPLLLPPRVLFDPRSLRSRESPLRRSTPSHLSRLPFDPPVIPRRELLRALLSLARTDRRERIRSRAGFPPHRLGRGGTSEVTRSTRSKAVEGLLAKRHQRKTSENRNRFSTGATTTSSHRTLPDLQVLNLSLSPPPPTLSSPLPAPTRIPAPEIAQASSAPRVGGVRGEKGWWICFRDHLERGRRGGGRGGAGS